jgi:hypothetical protein
MLSGIFSFWLQSQCRRLSDQVRRWAPAILSGGFLLGGIGSAALLWQDPVTITLGQWVVSLTSSTVLAGASLACGYVSGRIFRAPRDSQLVETSSRERRLRQQAEADSLTQVSRVHQLEQKIQTLEAALQKAMKRP